jgi:hypothetical protein
MLVFYRLISLALAITSLYFFGRLVLTGRDTAKYVDLQDDEFADYYRSQHKKRFWQITATTMIILFFVELVGRLVLHAIGHPLIYWINIYFFAGPFVILFVVVIVTGKTSKFVHRKLAPWCVGWGMATNIIGCVLSFKVWR